jgi:hypothetical protein
MPTDDEWVEADMAADEAAGKPLKRTAEEGIRDMERRIISLRARITAAEGNALLTDPQRAEVIADLRVDLQEAQARLKEYQIQLEGKN